MLKWRYSISCRLQDKCRVKEFQWHNTLHNLNIYDVVLWYITWKGVWMQLHKRFLVCFRYRKCIGKCLIHENHYDHPGTGNRELISFVCQKAAPECYYCSCSEWTIISIFVKQEEEIGVWQTPVCPDQASGTTGEGTQALANRLGLVWAIVGILSPQKYPLPEEFC